MDAAGASSTVRKELGEQGNDIRQSRVIRCAMLGDV
jgi:hypothetical protein